MSKLGDDNYKRPKQTYTDKLTDEDIKAKLEDYIEVDDISKAIRPSPPKNDGKHKKNNKHYKIFDFR